ncbi:MAG: hypothetical protein HY646_21185, partial [Acidobacteria bacterium]|nr:hypothetical protein [Acidobacteriota bacterium]
MTAIVGRSDYTPTRFGYDAGACGGSGEILHGSTVGTNALLERKGARPAPTACS